MDEPAPLEERDGSYDTIPYVLRLGLLAYVLLWMSVMGSWWYSV